MGARRPPPLETAERLWDEVMTANLKGSFLASLAAIPHLIRPGGRIVNIGSVTAFLGGHGGSIAYATSKAGPARADLRAGP